MVLRWVGLVVIITGVLSMYAAPSFSNCPLGCPPVLFPCECVPSLTTAFVFFVGVILSAIGIALFLLGVVDGSGTKRRLLRRVGGILILIGAILEYLVLNATFNNSSCHVGGQCTPPFMLYSFALDFFLGWAFIAAGLVLILWPSKRAANASDSGQPPNRQLSLASQLATVSLTMKSFQ